jgi:hypothetical protein
VRRRVESVATDRSDAKSPEAAVPREGAERRDDETFQLGKTEEYKGLLLTLPEISIMIRTIRDGARRAKRERRRGIA